MGKGGKGGVRGMCWRGRGKGGERGKGGVEVRGKGEVRGGMVRGRSGIYGGIASEC